MIAMTSPVTDNNPACVGAAEPTSARHAASVAAAALGKFMGRTLTCGSADVAEEDMSKARVAAADRALQARDRGADFAPARVGAKVQLDGEQHLFGAEIHGEQPIHALHVRIRA